MREARGPSSALGTPEAPSSEATEAAARVLCDQFDVLMAWMAVLQRQCDMFLHQVRTTKDRGQKGRLLAQARRFQQQYATIAVDHTRLQAQNKALQAQSRYESHGLIPS